MYWPTHTIRIKCSLWLLRQSGFPGSASIIITARSLLCAIVKEMCLPRVSRARRHFPGNIRVSLCHVLAKNAIIPVFLELSCYV
jgi:hypothetical protein